MCDRSSRLSPRTNSLVSIISFVNRGAQLQVVISAALSGFLTGLSLIVAIGAQNAFVLRQGLTGQHVFALCMFCSLSDAILISAGVAGFGALVAVYPDLGRHMATAGAAFFIAYGAMRFLAAWRGDYDIQEGAETRTLGSTLVLAAMFTWVNPHVYLDTVALIGAVSAGFDVAVRWAFAWGAILASFLFFFSLGYGAEIFTA